MDRTHYLTGKALSTLTLACSLLAGTETMAQPAQSLPDWPMYSGPSGNFSSASSGVELTSTFSKAPRLWKSEANDIPICKLSSNFCAAFMSRSHLPAGGQASLVVGSDMVFCRFFVPNSTVRKPSCGIDTLPESLAARLGIEADDVLIAINALTGKTVWRAVETKAGASRPPTKRGGWAVTPVYYNGRVYSTGTTGKVWAYDAAKGAKIWSSSTGGGSKHLDAALTFAIANKKFLSDVEAPYWIHDNLTSMVVAGNVLVVPAEGQALTGLNSDNGAILWERGGLQRITGTSGICKVGGREYLLCNSTSDSLRMIDPQNGKTLWSIKTGTNLGSVVASGDLFVCNTFVGGGRDGLFGLYRATTTGATIVWTLPKSSNYYHGTALDAGALRIVLIRDNVVYLLIKNSTGQRLLAAEMPTGKILKDTLLTSGGWGKTFHYAENHLIVCDDQSHTQGDSRMSFKFFTADQKAGFKYAGSWTTPFIATDGYEATLYHPMVGGLWFFRTKESNIQCFDFRKGAVGTSINGIPEMRVRLNSTGDAGSISRIFNPLGRLVAYQKTTNWHSSANGRNLSYGCFFREALTDNGQRRSEGTVTRVAIPK